MPAVISPAVFAGRKLKKIITPTGANTKRAIQTEMGPRVGRMRIEVIMPRNFFTSFPESSFTFQQNRGLFHSGRAACPPQICLADIFDASFSLV
jgi:hypothetical protein